MGGEVIGVDVDIFSKNLKEALAEGREKEHIQSMYRAVRAYKMADERPLLTSLDKTYFYTFFGLQKHRKMKKPSEAVPTS